jgi:TonB family protein
MCTIFSLILLSSSPVLAEKQFVSVNVTDSHPAASVRTYLSTLRSAIENNWCESAPHKNSLSVYFAIDAGGNLKAMEIKQSSGIQSDDNAALEAVSKCFVSGNAVSELKGPLKLDISFKPCEANTNEANTNNENANQANSNGRPAVDSQTSIRWENAMQSAHLSPLIQPDPQPSKSVTLPAEKVDQQIQPTEELLTLPQAREYALFLINRDRATEGRKPVKLDEVACRVAQYHSDTTAKLQFNSHWHPDGKKPAQRYCDLGGFDCDAENSHGCAPKPGFLFRVPDNQQFTKSEIEFEEHGFFDEIPPKDGHRRNILNPARTHVGLGLTLIELRYQGKSKILRHVTSSQEFINRYAENYFESARSLRRGVTYVFSGQLAPDARIHSAILCREDAPQPIPQNILQDQTEPKFHGSVGPAVDVVLSVFPRPETHTPEARLYTQGQTFRCEITPGTNWQPGLYYLTLWAVISGVGQRQQPFSMRTLLLE